MRRNPDQSNEATKLVIQALENYVPERKWDDLINKDFGTWIKIGYCTGKIEHSLRIFFNGSFKVKK